MPSVFRDMRKSVEYFVYSQKSYIFATYKSD